LLLKCQKPQRQEDMIERSKNYLLFDGDCGICSYSAEKVMQMDRSRRFVVEPYQAFPESELKRHGITYEQCERNMQIITRKGRVYAGAFGLNYFLWHQFPWTLPVILIYAFPVLLLLELIGYRLVADNRGRLSQWFGMKACLLKGR